MDSTRITKGQAMRRMLGLVKGMWPSFTFGIFTYSTQAATTGILSALMMGWLTQAALAGSIRAVIRAGAMFLLLEVVYFVVLPLGTYQYVVTALKLQKRLKTQLFSSFVYTSVEDLDTARGGISAINTEADTALNAIDNNLAGLLACTTAILFSGVAIFVLDWRLGFISLGAGLLSLFIQSRFAKPMTSVAKEQLDANSAAIGAVSGILNGSAAIRAFSLQERMQLLFEAENRRLMAAAFRETRLKTLQNILTNLQGWVALAGVMGVGSWLVATGRLSFGVLMMAPALSMSLGVGLAGIGNAWAGLQAPLEASRRVCTMLDKSRRIVEADAKRTRAGWNGDGTLRAQGLRFRYDGQDADTLRDIHLDVKEGAMVAFVGESGCGKSTLLRVLGGMYERGEVPVHLGNLSLGGVPAAQWREQFALVDQSCKLFDMTVAENIALGRKGATRQEVEQAAREAGAYEFITTLAGGFDAPCGEGGAQLSGGQKQRIAIARALCRKAPVLMLDEATAALDSQSQRSLMATVEHLRGSHTVLLVTHDLRQTQTADEIVVLKNGEIAERGTHEELLRQNGEYSRLWQKNTE